MKCICKYPVTANLPKNYKWNHLQGSEISEEIVCTVQMMLNLGGKEGHQTGCSEISR